MTLLVRPREGFRIRDPDRRDYVEPEGRQVPLNAYWFRRLQDGDVVRVDATAPAEIKLATKEIGTLDLVEATVVKKNSKKIADGGNDVSG